MGLIDQFKSENNQPVLLKKQYQLDTLLKEQEAYRLFKGIDLKSKRPIRVSQFSLNGLTELDFSDLLRVTERMISFRCPYLMPLIDYEFTGKGLFLVYEYLEEYSSLRTQLKQLDQMTMVSTEFQNQLLGAMEYMESKGLCLATINLDSIYMNAWGDIKVMDAYVSGLVAQALMQAGSQIPGSQFYPPEFFQGAPITIQGDIYAFAMLMTGFYTRVWPFRDIQKSNFRKVFSQDMQCLSKKVRVSPQFEIAIHAALCRDPSIRPNSVLEFQAMLREPGKETHTMKEIVARDQSYQRRFQAASQRGPQKEGRGIRFWLTLTVLPFVIFSLLYGAFHMYVKVVPSLVVPNIKTLSVEDAERILNEMDLKLKVVGYIFDSDIPAGYIVSVTPNVGKTVKKNRHIQVLVSRGVESIELWDLTNKSEEDIRTGLKLQDLSLNINATSFSNTVPKGHVISQFPSANAIVDRGSVVSVELSLGFPVTVQAIQDETVSEGLVKLIIRAEILQEWEPYRISVNCLHKDAVYKSYAVNHKPGDQLALEWTCPLDSDFEVYYADQKAYKNTVKNILIESNSQDEESVEDPMEDPSIDEI